MMGFPTRCPNCASAITIDSNRKIAYCEYCGTQLTRSTQQQELDIAEERIKYKLLKHTERIKELDYWHEKTKSEFRLRSAEISNKYLERILKIIGKLALFPAWLFSIKVLYDNFFSGSFGNILIMILLFILDLTIGLIVVFILLFKKW